MSLLDSRLLWGVAIGLVLAWAAWKFVLQRQPAPNGG